MLFHNPVILARRFATLDILSNWRTLSGLGLGWSDDEFLASNVPFAALTNSRRCRLAI